MSSSTSSSEPATGRPARVFRGLLGATTALVAAALVLLELFSRTALVSASKDLRRFRGYAGEAAALERVPARRLALVGNSATDRGVDVPLFNQLVAAGTGRPATAHKFVADASRINDWYFILNRYFFEPGVHADLAVITFYEGELEDGNRIEIGRLAQFFTRAADWPAVFDVDLPDFGDRVDFLISSGWMTFAVRSRIRDRVLDVLPGFGPFLEDVNGVNLKHARALTLARQARAAEATAAAPRSYRALDRLLGAARAHGLPLLFVSYPTAPVPASPPYVVPLETIARLGAAGAGYLDLRGRVPGLMPAHYADDVHLTPEGAALFTRALAEAVASQPGAR